MSVSYIGIGAFASGTTSLSLISPNGLTGDVLVALFGNKPYSTTPSLPGTTTTVTTGTSGTVTNGSGTGSVRATAIHRTAGGSGGTTTASATPSGSPVMAREYRFRVTEGTASVDGVTLADTSETGTTVSATGSAPAGTFQDGDHIVIGVVIKSSTATHSSRALSIPGCTVGTITWETVSTTTTGNDGSMYFGRAQITAGSSTGAATYTATATSGSSSTAVNVVRVRDVVSQDFTGGATFGGEGTLAGSGSPVLPPLASFSDDFNRDPGPLGPNWASVGNNPMTVLDNAVAGGANVSHGARWVEPTATDDQYSQARYKAGVVDGVAVAMPAFPDGEGASTAGEWYQFRVQSAVSVSLYRKDSGVTSATSLGTAQFVVREDAILRLEYVGGVLTGYVDGIARITHTPDTPIVGQRYVGLVNASGGGNEGLVILDDWSGGDVDPTTKIGGGAFTGEGTLVGAILGDGSTATPALRAVSAVEGSGLLTHTWPALPTYEPTDLVFAVLTRNMSGVGTNPLVGHPGNGGWTLVDDGTDAAQDPAGAHQVMWRATGAQITNGDVVLASASSTANCQWQAFYLVFQDVDLTDPFVTGSGRAETGNSATVTHTAPEQTNTEPAALGLFIALARQVASPASWTAGPGLTERLLYDRGSATLANIFGVVADTNGAVGAAAFTFEGTTSGGTAIAYMWSGFLRGVPLGGGTDFAGAASFTGTGDLSTVGVPGSGGGAGFTGAGSLGAVSTPRPTQVAAFAGSGSLTTTTTPRPVQAAAFAAAGSLAASGTPALGRVAAFTGAGTLAVTTAPRPGGAAALTGAGTLAAAATLTTATTATLTGDGTLTATTGQTVLGSAPFTGSGSLTAWTTPAFTADSTNRMPGFAHWKLPATGVTYDAVNDELVFTSNNTVNVFSPKVAVEGAAMWYFSADYYSETGGSTNFPNSGGALASSRYYDASGAVVQNSLGNTGNGRATALPHGVWSRFTWGQQGGPNVMFLDMQVQGSIAWTPPSFRVRNPQLTLQPSNWVYAPPGQVTLTGAGSLAATTKPTTGAAAGFSGGGTLAAAAAPTPKPAVTLTGAGSLTAAGTTAAGAAAGFTGAGSLTSTAVLATSGAAAFSGAGTLTAGQRIVTNHLPNPSAEFSGGFPSNNGTVWDSLVDTTVKRTGAQSRRGYLKAAQTSAAILSMYGIGLTSAGRVPLPSTWVEGEPLTASAHFRVDAPGYRARLQFVFYNTAGSALSAPLGPWSDIGADTWDRLAYTQVPPAGTVTMFVSAIVQTQSGNAVPLERSAWVDDVMLTVGADTHPYRDGDSPGWAWAGTPHQSTSYGPVPSVAVTQPAAFTGDGSLSGVAAPATAATAPFTGDGGLVASTTPAGAGATAFTGAGALAATTGVVVTRSATLTGSGSLAAASSPRLVTAAALTGTGVLVTAATAALAGVGVLTGAGTLAAAGTPAGTATTGLTGTGVLAAAGSLVATRAATLAGAGTLTTVTAPTGTGTVALTGAGALAATTTPTAALVAPLNGSGTLTAAAAPALRGAVALTGAGDLAVIAQAEAPGLATLDGQGLLTVASTPAAAQVASLTGDGALGVSGATAATRTATLTGSGSLTTSTALTVMGATSLTGAGTLAVVSGAAAAASAAFTGVGSLAAATTTTVGALATFASAGTLTVAATPATAQPAALTGAGTLVAATETLGAASLNLTGSGSLTAAAGLRGTAAAPFTGDGTIAATAAPSPRRTTTFTGAGTLATVRDVTTSTTVPFTGDGDLSATGGTEATEAAYLTGTGILTTRPTPRFTTLVTLDGAGELLALTRPGGATEPTFTGDGTLYLADVTPGALTALVLTGDGLLSAVPEALRFTADVELTGHGQLTTVAEVTGFSAWGVPI